MSKPVPAERPHPGPGRQTTCEVLEPWLAVIHTAYPLEPFDWQALYDFAIDLANAREHGRLEGHTYEELRREGLL